MIQDRDKADREFQAGLAGLELQTSLRSFHEKVKAGWKGAGR